MIEEIIIKDIQRRKKVNIPFIKLDIKRRKLDTEKNN